MGCQVNDAKGRIKLGELSDFLADVRFQDEVLIVGAGPSARMLVPRDNPHWRRLVEGRTIVLCNGCPDVEGADVFTAFDGAVTNYEWYRAGRAKHYLLGYALAAKQEPPADYYTFCYWGALFDLLYKTLTVRRAPEGLFKPNSGPHKGYLHSGGTITAAALQLAMHYDNVSRIYLIGCDHTGGSWHVLNAPTRRFGPLLGNLVQRAIGGRFYPGRAPVEVYHIGFSLLPCPQVKP